MLPECELCGLRIPNDDVDIVKLKFKDRKPRHIVLCNNCMQKFTDNVLFVCVNCNSLDIFSKAVVSVLMPDVDLTSPAVVPMPICVYCKEAFKLQHKTKPINRLAC